MEKEIVISGNEKMLKLMRSYLQYVVIVGLSYWNIHQDVLLQAVQKERNDDKQRALEYWRNAYVESGKTYLLIIQKQQDDAQRQLEQSRH